MTDHQITFHPVWPPALPWHREEVRLDGELVGQLLYRRIEPIPGMNSGPGWTQYLIADRAHRPLGEPRRSFLDRTLAVTTLIGHITAGMEVA